MPKREDISKILIFGPGPERIGQGGAAPGPEAVEAVRALGYTVGVVDVDPSSTLADVDHTDAAYLEPLVPAVVSEIIKKERPDAILPGLGGRAGLNLCLALAESGLLEENGIRILGVGVEAIRSSQDRGRFHAAMAELDIPRAEAVTVSDVEEAEAEAERLGLPLMLRPAGIWRKTGSRVAYNLEEVRDFAGIALADGPVRRVVMERSLAGWQEAELELFRDVNGHHQVVAVMAHLNPVGVHSADSVILFPAAPVPDAFQRKMVAVAKRISDLWDLRGPLNLRFAWRPETERICLLSVAPRFSRSAALAGTATGYPTATAAALLACDLGFDEIVDTCGDAGGVPLSDYAVPDGYMAVRVPRWSFDAFPEAGDRLDTLPRSTGEMLGVGATFTEAFERAMAGLDADETRREHLEALADLSTDELTQRLGRANADQVYQMAEALRRGLPTSTLSERTGVHPWFIEHLAADGHRIGKGRGGDAGWRTVSRFSGAPKLLVRAFDSGSDGTESVNGIPIPPSHPKTGKRMVILGPGPHRIGHGVETDFCCLRTARAARADGYEIIVVDVNPGLLHQLRSLAERLYLSPLTPDAVTGIVRRESPDAVIAAFHDAQVADHDLGLGRELANAGIPLIGASPCTDPISDPDIFSEALRSLGIPQLRGVDVLAPEGLAETAASLGYPVSLHAPNGARLDLIRDEADLKAFVEENGAAVLEFPIQMRQFPDKGMKAEATVLSDGERAMVPAIIEYVEPFGVHMGDSACVTPPISITTRHQETIHLYAEKVALRFGVKGLMTLQCAIYDDTVYVLGAGVGVSRTVPFVSRLYNLPLCRMAYDVLMGKGLPNATDATRPATLPYFGVREAVFAFQTFPESDPLLGPEMRSCGQVMGISDAFGRAYFKAQEAADATLPLEGTVLITVADRDKPAALEAAVMFRDMGFRLMATRGTRSFLGENGVDAEAVKKLGFGRPDIVDVLKSGAIDLVINTTTGPKSQADDAYIRKTTLACNIPNITTTAAAITAARGIAERRNGAPKVRPLQDYYRELR